MAGCLGRNKPKPSPPITMANLTIRNVTITPLELRKVERLEAEPIPEPKGLANITSTITNIFNGTAAISIAVPRLGVPPKETRDISGVDIAPFTTRSTDIRAAEPGTEVLRLTFGEPGTGFLYKVDAPASSPRSSVMTREGGAIHEFTVVYTSQTSSLAILSSAQLHQWMHELHDDYPLSLLSIPGTHNSPTCHKALPSVRCQAVGVREQLNNGVRFLDIRVSCPTDSSDLTLVHSVFPISLTGSKSFTDLLSDVYAFLDANRTETVLMSIKREGTGKGSDADLAKYLNERYMGGDASGKWFRANRVPTLGETRGKIVLVRRFGNVPGDANDWGVDGSSWPDNCADGTCGSNLIRVQDFYEIDQSTNIEKKIDLARAHLARAAEPTFVPGKPDDHPQFFINFLSASNFFSASCWPEKIAAKVNPAIIEHLCMQHADKERDGGKVTVGDAATGIVVTDWVGADDDWDLIRCIVGWNARLQLRK